MINLFRQEPVRAIAAPATLTPDNRGASAENESGGSCAATANINTININNISVNIDVEAIAGQLAHRPRRARIRADWARMASTSVLALTFLVCLLHSELLPAMLSLCALFTLRLCIRLPERHYLPNAMLQDSPPDRRWLGGLAEALEWPNRRVQAGAGLLLQELLPQVTAQDAEVFTEEQTTCLYRRLTRRAALANPELALAILRVLPYIGTEAALPYIERLAKLTVFSGKRRRLRNAAGAMQALLERRIASQRALQSVVIPTTPAKVETRSVSEAEIALESGENSMVTAENSDGNGIAGVTSLVDAQILEFEQELRRLQKPGMRIGFLIASWGIILPYCAVQTYLQFAAGNRLGAIIFCALTLLSARLHRLTLTNQHRLLARKFAKLDDMRCMGRLAEALEWPDTTVRHHAIAALTRLLPRMAANDAALLTPRQRLNLHHMLKLENARIHPEFLCAILKALEQIGDATSVPYVDQLARAQPTSARQRRICDAARECLPFLETRARLNQSSQTLLRASSANATHADMLVRPAGGPGEMGQEQLLRPSHISENV
jgi:hypothetical protein